MVRFSIQPSSRRRCTKALTHSLLHHLLDRQIGGLSAFENFAGVDAAQAMHSGKIASVAHQTAGCDELAPYVGRGHRVAGRQSHDLGALAGEKRVSADDERPGAELDKGSEGCVDLARGARRQDMQL
jgi:hypothetical protein